VFQCTRLLPWSCGIAVVACGKRWGGMGAFWSFLWSVWVAVWFPGYGVGGFFWMAFVAAAFACSLVNAMVIYRRSMLSALSGGSSSSSSFSLGLGT
jgi:membrane-bound metal-dependent hydrolase YbcI (DUF457 family)